MSRNSPRACPVRYPVPQTQFSPSGPPSTRPEDWPPKIIWISRFRSGIACLRGCQKLSATALGPVFSDSGAGPRQIKSGARCARHTEAISSDLAASRALQNANICSLFARVSNLNSAFRYIVEMWGGCTIGNILPAIAPHPDVALFSMADKALKHAKAGSIGTDAGGCLICGDLLIAVGF